MSVIRERCGGVTTSRQGLRFTAAALSFESFGSLNIIDT
jgi:hypothetical protein